MGNSQEAKISVACKHPRGDEMTGQTSPDEAIDELKAELEALIRVLAFYARPATYIKGSAMDMQGKRIKGYPILKDRGEYARQTLRAVRIKYLRKADEGKLA